jgi:hypothetical protein
LFFVAEFDSFGFVGSSHPTKRNTNIVSIEIILILNIPIQISLKIKFRGEKDINCVKIDNPAI